MPLQNFVDNQLPTIKAAWLNIVDVLTTSVFASAATPAAARTAIDVTSATTQAASGGSALIGFLQTGAGTVARTVQDKLRDLIALADFSSAANYNTAAAAPTSEIAVGFIATGGPTNVNVPADGAAGVEVIDIPSARKGLVTTTYGATGGPYWHGQKARGTLAAPTKALNGDVVFSIGGRPYGPAGFASSTVAIIGTINEDANTNSPISQWTIEVSDSAHVRQVVHKYLAAGNTMPLQPAFLVPATVTANATGDTTAATVNWGAAIYDQGSNFAANNFTAPVTGKYHFGVILRGTGLAAGNTFFQVSLVTTARTIALIEINPGGIIFGATALTLSGGIDVPMTAGDVANVTFRADGGAKIVGYAAASFFSGRLVC